MKHRVRAAIDAVAAIAGDLTFGTLHGDPAPEAFRYDPASGRTGLIDWSAVTRGPLLYDVASAVMYLGGPASASRLLSAYAASGLVSATELNEHLSTRLRFRWAVQADYFARRMAEADTTGVDSLGENDKGLADARRALTVD